MTTRQLQDHDFFAHLKPEVRCGQLQPAFAAAAQLAQSEAGRDAAAGLKKLLDPVLLRLDGDNRTAVALLLNTAFFTGYPGTALELLGLAGK